MKKIFTILSFFLSCISGMGQNYPVYNQYFNNPYLINPAFVGKSGYTEIGATHRRQWMGIEGAPVLTSINLQYPTKKFVSLGLTLTNSDVVSERRTSLQGTFGYKLMLGEDQFFRFGLSGGVGNYHLDASQIEDESLNDPAVQKLLGSHYFFDGQFGLAYTYKGLNIGFAVPRLFDTRTLNNSRFKDVSYAELKFNLVSASYKFNIGSSGIAFEPSVLYRMGNQVNEKWEGLGSVSFKDIFWVGGSYRQQYGPTAFAGIAIKNMKFGYSFEIPTSPMAAYSKGSHEIQLSLRLGKDRSIKPKTKKTTPVVKTNAEKPQKTIQKENVQPDTSSKSKELPKASAPVSNTENEAPVEDKVISKAVTENIVKEAPGSEIKIEEKKSSHPLELNKANYLVVGVFKFVKNAETYKKQLKAQGHISFIGYSSKSGSFYVYLSKYDQIEDAREERTGVRELETFSNAWIMSVE